VLLWHYVVVLLRSQDAGWWTRAGTLLWSGVDLFFVLSGFLIGGILIDARGSDAFFRTFYTRRFYRILPLYFVLLALFFIARITFAGIASGEWLFRGAYPWWAYASFTQNFLAARGGPGGHFLDVTWSLAVEEQFYLTVPLLIYFAPPRHLLRVVIVLFFLVFVARIYIYQRFGWFASYVLMPARADALTLGIIGAIIVRSQQSVAWLKSHAAVLRMALFVAAGGAAAMLLLRIGITNRGMAYGGFTWLAAGYLALLLYIVIVPEARLAGLMQLRPLRALGVVAYFVYMFHQCVMGLVFGLVANHEPGLRTTADAGLVLLSLIVTLSLAALSWRWFEKPLIRLGHQTTY